MNPLLPALASALILTIATEYLVLLILIRNQPGMLLLYAILINGVTNPLLNYVYLFHYPILWPLEAGVILTETLLISLLIRIGCRYAFFCSVCANTVSILAGKLLL